MSAPAVRPGIMEIAPYVGGESSLKGVDRVVKLASNEGAFGPSPKAVEAYREAAPAMHRYPDGNCVALRGALEERWGLDAERIVCGAGSDEILGLLCRAYAGPGDEALYTEHGFLMYPIFAHSVGATPIKAPETNLKTDVDALLARVTERTRIVFLANPNNPTGSYLTADEMAGLRARLPDHVLLVIDAAYAEFVDRDDYDPGTALVDAGENVVMTRTFSKIFALGGLRLGWGYCPPAVADVLNRSRNPFNVASAAQAAGVAALEDRDFFDKCRAHNLEWLAWTRGKLQALGIDAPDSAANFALARFGSEEKALAADGFLRSRGIIVRRMASYGLPDSLRISIGLEDEMRLIIDTLSDFMDTQS